MTGRGIDQILAHPCDPRLHESYVKDARDYVALAEVLNGRIPRPVAPKYIWGDALAELGRSGADLRIINLETSITRSSYHWADKGIHYRMHPQNISCLTEAKVHACSLANNHTLDWGHAGLEETLDTLEHAGLVYAGAGRNAQQAESPGIIDMPGKGRVLLFAFGTIDSGIPEDWRATANRAGLWVLDSVSGMVAEHICRRLQERKRSNDIAIASIHWGTNWGYQVSPEQVEFAHRLIDGGFDLVHGHSSHHARHLEVYRNRLILYGCGDFINDYEGITGREEFRGDLAVMYLVKVDLENGNVLDLRLVPFQMKRFQLKHASGADREWLCTLLNTKCEAVGTKFQATETDGVHLML